MNGVLGWDWYGDKLLRYQEAEKWSEALRDEVCWNSWRGEVLDILNPFFFLEYYIINTIQVYRYQQRDNNLNLVNNQPFNIT